MDSTFIRNVSSNILLESNENLLSVLILCLWYELLWSEMTISNFNISWNNIINHKQINKMKQLFSMNFLSNLDAERVEDHVIHCCDIKVKDHETQRVQAKHHLQELSWVSFQKHFNVGMAFHHCHFHICNRTWLLLPN